MSFLFLCGISLMIVSTSGCIHEELLRLLYILATERLPVPSRPWARKCVMSTLRFTAGVGVSFSGACGLPLV